MNKYLWCPSEKSAGVSVLVLPKQFVFAVIIYSAQNWFELKQKADVVMQK